MAIDELIRLVKFDTRGLIPAIIQEKDTGEVLMLGYMNEESLRKSFELKEAVFWSRSRQTLWHKGETSGHVQRIQEVRIDCYGNSLLIKVDQVGDAACHTGYKTCYYRRYDEGKGVSIDQERVFNPDEVYGDK